MLDSADVSLSLFLHWCSEQISRVIARKSNTTTTDNERIELCIASISRASYFASDKVIIHDAKEEQIHVSLSCLFLYLVSPSRSIARMKNRIFFSRLTKNTCWCSHAIECKHRYDSVALSLWAMSESSDQSRKREPLFRIAKETTADNEMIYHALLRPTCSKQ